LYRSYIRALVQVNKFIKFGFLFEKFLRRFFGIEVEEKQA